MKRSTFPTLLFRWFLSQQILISGLVLAALGAGLFSYLESGGFALEALHLGREMVLIALGASFAVFILVALYTTRRLLVPLGRLIERTRRMREFPFDADDGEMEALTYNEPGEWYELERALNRLGRDLRQKTIRLSHEKTELRAIMSAISEAVLSVSKDKRVLFYNPQFAYLFNLKPSAAEARISEILRAPAVLEAYDEALSTGETVRREAQVAVSPERLARHFQLSVAPLRKKHNQEIYGAVGILHDITELKQAERIRIEFVGNVSHELRSPLTSINGYLQTLAADLKNGRLEQAQEFLGIVTKNAGRLKNLVDDLLDLSALESGKELSIAPVDVREITETVLGQLADRKHEIHMKYDFTSMNADPSRLEQVLRNLLENAIRYVPAGKSVHIHWRRGVKGQFELSVKDDGPGIAPEHQKRLFERFYRVDESRSRAAGGTGIGLSLVKHIMQRHGGQVTVHSEVGEGSEFICEFPAELKPIESSLS